jgi:hypothetical protein
VTFGQSETSTVCPCTGHVCVSTTPVFGQVYDCETGEAWTAAAPPPAPVPAPVPPPACGSQTVFSDPLVDITWKEGNGAFVFGRCERTDTEVDVFVLLLVGSGR